MELLDDSQLVVELCALGAAGEQRVRQCGIAGLEPGLAEGAQMRGGGCACGQGDLGRGAGALEQREVTARRDLAAGAQGGAAMGNAREEGRQLARPT